MFSPSKRIFPPGRVRQPDEAAGEGRLALPESPITTKVSPVSTANETSRSATSQAQVLLQVAAAAGGVLRLQDALGALAEDLPQTLNL